MHKKRRKPVPHTILWSIQDQRRFIDAVERLHDGLHALEVLQVRIEAVVDHLVAKTCAARQAAETRRQRKESANGAETPLQALPPADPVL